MISFLSSAGAMCVTFGDCLDDRALEFGLRILAVVDEIEAIRNDAGLGRLAVARGEGGAVFAFIGIGRLVQIDMEQEASAQRCDQAQQRRRLRGGTAFLEGAVRVDGIRVPAMNALVGPGAHAGHREQIDSLA